MMETSVLALINNSRNSFQNKMGGQKSAFFEISIEIKSAQPVSCSDEAELVGRPGASDAHAELQQGAQWADQPKQLKSGTKSVL